MKSPSLPSLSLPEDQAEKELPVANIIELSGGDKCAWDKGVQTDCWGGGTVWPGRCALSMRARGPEKRMTRRCYPGPTRQFFARRQAFPARTEAAPRPPPIYFNKVK